MNHYMVPYPNLACEDYAGTQLRTTRNAALADYQTIRANLYIMGHLDQVINLGPGSYTGNPEFCPVNGTICPNFNIIGNFNLTYLGYFPVFTIHPMVPVTVGASRSMGIPCLISS